LTAVQKRHPGSACAATAQRRSAGQNSLEDALGCRLVAVLLQQDVEFGTVLINGTPQQVRLTAKRHKHLVKVPCGT